MQIRRIITGEAKIGVATTIDTIDTETIDFVTNIWGFDRVPNLPLRSEEVLGEYKKMGMFGPLGGIRVDLYTLPPETGDGPAELRGANSIDMGTPGMVLGKEGDGMHRTDSIDFSIVIDGEPTVAYPGEDGQVHELTLKTGDLIVHNGTFHSWHNRSAKDFTILFVVLAAERKTA
ncbi:hypothetical protein [Mucilaginibacter sp. dw_454]|uniref:hypothetical protein n=1 Tax=Mucilaginibacter sp. dw_454 TaxID=2720079 RepID=UPI001BD5EABE|nr:hypothetical protein [Mucilaginibacter sp. dw_454]